MFRPSSIFCPITRNLYHSRNINTRLVISRHGLLTRRTLARTTLGALTFSSFAWAGTVFADAADSDLQYGHSSYSTYGAASFSSLVRAYVVFSMCSMPWLVDASPAILKTFSSVPVVREVTEGFLRMTFFKQFVGADTVDECIPVLHALRKANQGVLFAYSVEERSVDTNSKTNVTGTETIPQSHKLAVRDLLHSIDVAADFEDGLVRQSRAYSDTGTRSTWIAIKISTLLPDPYALVVLSSSIVDAKKQLKSMGGSDDVLDVPFPGAPRIQDFNTFLSREASLTLSNNLNSSKREAQSYLYDLRLLYSDLVNICTRARDRGVTITIDAEESWYQPAIDLLTLALMREFNKRSTQLEHPWPVSSTPTRPKTLNQSCPGPLIYLTVQAYLRRTPSFLNLIFEDAKSHQYALGIKLVRGAYWDAETALHSRAHAQAPLSNGAEEAELYKKTSDAELPTKSFCLSPEPHPPVWLTKDDTDNTYDECVRVLLKGVKEDVDRCRNQLQEKTTKEVPSSRISVYFGTHNWKSTRLILQEMVRNGLGEIEMGEEQGKPELEGDFVVKIDEDIVQRVSMGQLYGMSDDLSDWLVSHTVTQSPFVIRYLPYGPLQHVMPYLSRRAIENKSVLGAGGAVMEKKRAAKEILIRVRNFFG